jgi:hypothetical protein
MKKLLLLAFLICVSAGAYAQLTKENHYGINNLRFEARVDFDCYSQHDSIYSGFTGKYLNFIMSGNLTKDFFYSYRQRINNLQNISNFFDATDYLYFGWNITENIAWTAGKEIVAIGGAEYDLAPIDVYFNSNFWDNINCFRFGTNLEYTTNDGKNTFILQFTNSPYDKSVVYGSLYNYSFYWCANYKHFNPICSVNMLEYRKGTFQNIIALGTNYKFGPVAGFLDFQNRASGDQEGFFFKDITVIGKIGYVFLHDKMYIFLKAGYDVNDAQDYTTPYDEAYDLCVLPGTDIKFYGGGLEFYPLKHSKDIRIHAFFAVHDASDSMVNEAPITYQANAGLTWRLNFIKK